MPPRRSIDVVRIASLLEPLLLRDDDDIPNKRGGDEGGDTDLPRARFVVPVVHFAPLVESVLLLLLFAALVVDVERAPLMLFEVL